ncbi:hypothetical protein T439DRAFT_254285 [Meredithblackwellia eburnea MCA 4105]
MLQGHSFHRRASSPCISQAQGLAARCPNKQTSRVPSFRLECSSTVQTLPLFARSIETFHRPAPVRFCPALFTPGSSLLLSTACPIRSNAPLSPRKVSSVPIALLPKIVRCSLQLLLVPNLFLIARQSHSCSPVRRRTRTRLVDEPSLSQPSRPLLPPPSSSTTLLRLSKEICQYHIFDA